MVDWRAAKRTLRSVNEGDCWNSLADHWQDFLVRIWEHFYDHGTLADMPRSGRPTNIPAAVAKEAAALVKEGEWVSVVRQGTALRKKVYYTSIFHAVSKLDRLREIMQQYDVDCRGLLHAMHQHDPDLTQRSIYFKYEFPPELLQARVTTTAELLENLPPPGAERRAWLDRLIWIDEGGVMLSDYAKKSVKVWCSKHDFNRNDVVHLPHVRGQDECKVHFILAVTSHPRFMGKNGLVYWEFTTGTTNIRRRRNTLGQVDGEAFGYQVGISALAITVLPYASVRVVHEGCNNCCNKMT